MEDLSGDLQSKESISKGGEDFIKSILGALSGAAGIHYGLGDILAEQAMGDMIKGVMSKDGVTPTTLVFVAFKESNGVQKYLGSYHCAYRSDKDKADFYEAIESYKAGLLEKYQRDYPLEKVKLEPLFFTDEQLASPLFSRYIIESAGNQWAVQQLGDCVKQLRVALDPSHFSPVVVALFTAMEHALDVVTIKSSTQLPKDISGN